MTPVALPASVASTGLAPLTLAPWLDAAAAQTGFDAAVEADVIAETLRLVGFSLLSATVSGLAALGYRWYTGDRLGAGLATLFGLASVAFYLNTVGLFGSLVSPEATADVFTLEQVTLNLLGLGVAAVGAPIGRAAGDRVAADVTVAAGARELDTEVSSLARAVRRVRAVELPEDVADLEGYDPVSDELKAEFEGKQLLFPARLTAAELHDRLVTRLKEDYEVGHVDVELTDWTVSYLAVGSRAAGVGHTLAPGTAAVAVRAETPPGAGPGDVVQVWKLPTPGGGDEGSRPGVAGAATGDGAPGASDAAGTDAASGAGGRVGDGEGTGPATPERVAVAELRGTTDGTATLVLDETEATGLDAASTYRLVALPTEVRVDREFATLLRNADETMGIVTVEPDGTFAGRTVGDLDVTVAAVRPVDGPVEAVPRRSRRLVAGDRLYVVARPETLRRLGARFD